MSDTKLTEAQKAALNQFADQAIDDSVSKAITTGHEIDSAKQEDGAALRTEFLDDEITMLTFTEGDLEFYRDIPKLPASSTVAEYVVYNRHGESGPTQFVREIGISPVSDPRLTKKRVNMKFISTTKQISLAAQMVNNISDPMQIATRDGITSVAKTIEWASFYGDSDLTNEIEPGNGLQFDGLAKLIDNGNVIDAKGQPLTEELLNQAAVTVGKGYGVATDAYMPIGVQADFINNYLSRQTQLVSENSGDVNLGFRVQGFNSARGFIRLHGSTVMELDNILDEHVRPAPGSPLAPAVETPRITSDDGGKFREEDLGAVEYKVVSNGEQGASGASQVATATVENAGDSVTLEINVQGLYAQDVQYVSIYRKGKTTGLYYLIDRVPASKAQNDVITYVDRNDTLPETADVFVGEMNESVIHLFELLPMMRLPLAQMTTAITFSILWYGALALRSPKKWVRIKNVRYITVPDPHNTF